MGLGGALVPAPPFATVQPSQHPQPSLLFRQTPSAGHCGWSLPYITIVLIPNGLWIAFPAAAVAALGPAIVARLARQRAA